MDSDKGNGYVNMDPGKDNGYANMDPDKDNVYVNMDQGKGTSNDGMASVDAGTDPGE